MNQSEQHRYDLLGLVYAHPKGIVNKTIMKRTGMTQPQLTTAAQALATKITKYYTGAGRWGYKVVLEKSKVDGMATSREAVPIYALPAYTGEFKRAGAVL